MIRPSTLSGTGQVVALAVFFVLGVFSTPARAEFAICNQTFDVVNVSIGLEVGGTFQTEGWWTIGTNQCANVIKDELWSRYIYIHATDVFGQSLLDGRTGMCVASKKFVINGIDECLARGHIPANFYEVDTQAVERWTFFLGQSQ